MTISTINNKDGVTEFYVEQANNFNLKNISLHSDIMTFIANASADDKIKSLVITGVPNAFHVGEDLDTVKAFFKANISLCIDNIIKLYIKVLECEKPIIIAALGNVSGIGFPLCLLCDRCIGTQNTKFFMPELMHGISSIIGSTIIEYILGYQLSKEVLYTGKIFEGDDLIKNKIANIILHESKDNEFRDDIHAEAIKMGALINPPFINTKNTISKNLKDKLVLMAESAKKSHAK